MTPRQAFGVVVRSIGLIVVLYGIYPLVNEILLATGNFKSILICVLYLVAGLNMIWHAEYLVRFAYGREK